MKRLAFSAALFAGLMLGQPGNWSQRFQAKYGTPAPAEQQRLKEEAASSAHRHDTTRPAEKSAEQRFRSKYGRPSPAEEAREREAQANTAFREETSKPDSDAWLRNYMNAKHGRDLRQK